MALKGREKTAASRAWLERNDYVQHNVWLPRELRDEFHAFCEASGVTKRGVTIGLIETWCQKASAAGVGVSGKINLKELREFAGMTRDHPNELVYSDAVLALVEAVEAAQRVATADTPGILRDISAQRELEDALDDLKVVVARFEGGAS